MQLTGFLACSCHWPLVRRRLIVLWWLPRVHVAWAGNGGGLTGRSSSTIRGGPSLSVSTDLLSHRPGLFPDLLAHGTCLATDLLTPVPHTSSKFLAQFTHILTEGCPIL